MKSRNDLLQLIAERHPQFISIAKSLNVLMTGLEFWFDKSRAEYFDDPQKMADILDEGAKRFISQFNVSGNFLKII